jgi:hypothetical protein
MGWTEKQFADLCEKAGVKPEDALKTGRLDLSPEHKAAISKSMSDKSKRRHVNERRAKKGYATKLGTGVGICSKKPKPNSPYALVETARRTAKNPESAHPRIGVKITAYRLRYLDPDNNTASFKFILDCLQLCGAIPGDSWEQIKLESAQSKVSSRHQEKTVITIEYPDPDP